MNAAGARPKCFTRRNAGPQTKTAARVAFAQGIAAEHKRAKRQALALVIWDHPDAAQHFKTYDAVYRIPGRREFS